MSVDAVVVSNLRHMSNICLHSGSRVTKEAVGTQQALWGQDWAAHNMAC